MKQVKSFYNKLPKELKVALYLLSSNGLSMFATYLLEPDTSKLLIGLKSIILSSIVNLLLVFSVEMKSRADSLKDSE